MENLSREPKTLQKLPPTHKHTTKTPRTDNPSFTSLSRGCRRPVRADILKGINITGVSTSIMKTQSSVFEQFRRLSSCTQLHLSSSQLLPPLIVDYFSQFLTQRLYVQKTVFTYAFCHVVFQYSNCSQSEKSFTLETYIQEYFRI